jgi:hypothetical protein
MCDVFVEEIEKRQLEASRLPHSLCTHVLFRIELKNAVVPHNVNDGKIHYLIFVVKILIHASPSCSLTNHSFYITAEPFIDEIKERNLHKKPETEIILNIVGENKRRRFGNVYWNQDLQGNLIRSLIRRLRFLIGRHSWKFC